ncbi:hypothetical protein [Nocardiopsis sp. CNT312]|uniref:hypothetical protein n=1 Tax=Nocardiopsis sp. CNT312 TaxID=1137268 RepID=UPI00048C5F23|nr:hypothetical protein [Nocardiopsis sp. CNT312]
MLRIGGLDVRAAFDSSFQSLSRLEESAFRLLSLLPGERFSMKAAGQLLGWEPAGTQRALERFTDSHLLEMVPGIDGETYYRFPALTLSYARERLSMSLTGEPDGSPAGPARLDRGSHPDEVSQC